MSTRLTRDQLEKMTTHELAELLSNVVLLLRRMPNVECGQLAAPVPGDMALQENVPATPAEVATPTKKVSKKKQLELTTTELSPVAPTTGAAYTAEELKKKTVVQLKKLANELYILFPSSARKDDLISKILTKQSQEHSEQFAIQNL
ncbi:MAG: hypothetical protein E6J34_22255 [Chloroflexi bacterium]|nr:MAG: hypothetical protein E6J34_22255 [Chloroflexota bacterium]